MDLLLIFSILQLFLHSKGKGLHIGILKGICMTLLGMGKWSESPYTANIILIKAWHLFSCSLEQTACCLELEIWKAEELPTVQRVFFSCFSSECSQVCKLFLFWAQIIKVRSFLFSLSEWDVLCLTNFPSELLKKTLLY